MSFRNTIYSLLFIVLTLCQYPFQVYGQEKAVSDTFFLAKKKGILGKIGKSISVSGDIPITADSGVQKNEESYAIFKGKTIHSIFIQKPGFNGTVNDTSKRVKNFFNDIGNRLHPNTSDKIIKRNLFFKETDTLYPALVADNERFLRDISYLQDARILVRQNDLFKDQVDVIVVCKDVFPVGGSADLGSAKLLNFEINDDNLAGTGDRIAIANLIDLDRNPHYGFSALYLKRNLMGSFIDLSWGFSNMIPAFNSGRREENVLYFKADLPLVSPYRKWTGSFETALRYTSNRYINDSIYQSDFKYRMRVFDGWIGYNLGTKKHLSNEEIKNRLKHLIAIRGIHRNYEEIPKYYQTNYNSDYSNLSTVLGSLTVFEQDYYHTNYIYGFGRNEDVPEGFSMSMIGGWTNRNNVSRPYLGFDYQRNYFTRKKNYINYILRFGGYFGDNRFEDLSILTAVETFTRLRKLGASKWLNRHFLSGSLTQLINTRLNDPLRLSSIYGIPDFNNINSKISTRATLNCESVFYNTWKFVGFNFAPFVFTNLSLLKEQNLPITKADLYSAIGTGIRTRNENLVFGTMELRAAYYPRTINNMPVWNITFNTALQYKYNSSLVKRPDFVVVN
jgi:hypothetical protein